MDELTVRWAEPRDARGIAEVHVASWRAAYDGLIDAEVLARLDVDARERMWLGFMERLAQGKDTEPGVIHRLLVAERGGEVVGFCAFGRGRDEPTDMLGEIGAIYALSSEWGSGVGHGLMIRTEDELVAEGYKSAYLWVLEGNERAISFYERHGWMGDGTLKIGAAGGATGLREWRHVRRFDVAGT